MAFQESTGDSLVEYVLQDHSDQSDAGPGPATAQSHFDRVGHKQLAVALLLDAAQAIHAVALGEGDPQEAALQMEWLKGAETGSHKHCLVPSSAAFSVLSRAGMAMQTARQLFMARLSLDAGRVVEGLKRAELALAAGMPVDAIESDVTVAQAIGDSDSNAVHSSLQNGYEANTIEDMRVRERG